MLKNLLGSNMKYLRTSHHLTQERVSDILNISRQGYSNYENGKRLPDVEQVVALSALYHVSLDDLILTDLEEEVSYEASCDTHSKIARVAEDKKSYCDQEDSDSINLGADDSKED